MSRWEDQFLGHEIFSTLDDLGERLKDDALISEDIDVIELVEKIKSLAIYANNRFRNAIPELVNIGQLNKANSQLVNVRNELNNYIANGNVAHLNNAVGHVDAFMGHIIYCPSPQHTMAEDIFAESLSSFKGQIKDAFNVIKEEKDRLLESVINIQESSTDQSEKLESLASEIGSHSNNIERQLVEFNERYEKFTSEANKRIEAELAESEREFGGLLEECGSSFKESLENQKSAGERTINALEQYKKQASDLVQVIGNIGITGNYQKIANSEKQAADKWRNIALWLMIAMVVVIGATVALSAANGFDWKLVLFRIGAALILVVPATYAARESSKHRILENINRKAELELASLDPFLEKLPEEVRNRVKEELTSKFFGAQDLKDIQEERVSYSSLLDLLKTAIAKK